MSKKSDSKIPSELNENFGSNYMMDGFWHDMGYEDGLKDSIGRDPIPQPATSGMAQIPDGMILALEDELDIETQEHEGALDLEGIGIVASHEELEDFDIDRSDTGITDHTWLSHAFQDPMRLPDKPVDNGIPELMEAWGDRTDGIQRIDLRDRDERIHQDGFMSQEDDDPRQHDKLASVVRSAMRMSAAGTPVSAIKRKVASQLNVREARRVLAALRAIEAEHGLVGNVYVRASAYPGLEKGKWKDALVKAARGARYLVAACGQDCSSCACHLGLKVVQHPDEIDWNDSFSHYAARLGASRKMPKTAKISDKREALRRAFLAEELVPKTHVETAKVRHVTPSERISAKKARETLAAHSSSRDRLDGKMRESSIAENKVRRKLGSLRRANLITAEEESVLSKSAAPVHTRLKMAQILAARSGSSEFRGALVGDARVSITAEEYAKAGTRGREAQTQMRTASASSDAQRSRLLEGFRQLESRYESARAKLAKVADAVVARGINGNALRKMVDGLFTDAERTMVRDALGPVLVKGGYYEQEGSGEPREYQGSNMREADYQRPEVVVPAKEITAAVRWTRQQMSEGFASKDLDDLIDQTVAPRVKSAASQQLVQIRRKHEGLSGHLYVDAAAYATPRTVKGCDQGALRHRSNEVPYVLSMSRCGSCVYKNADGVCQKYNKKLVDEIPAEAEEFRQRVLASHQAEDDVSSMFHDDDVRQAANPNPVDEFGLHNAALDDLETEEFSSSSLDGIFFGGFEL